MRSPPLTIPLRSVIAILSMLRRVLEFLAFVLAALACPLVSMAVTGGSYGGYIVRIWQTEDGLPENAVTAIAQTHDGYMWFGTLAGLARFDGERFLTFDSTSTPRLPDGRISALYEDQDGTLWIGHENGAVTRYRNGRFEILPAKPGRYAKVAAIGADEAGVIWILRMSGEIARADGEGGGSPPAADGKSKLVRFARNAAGRILFSVEGNANELRDGKAVPVDLGPARFTGYVRGVCAADAGGWWVVRDGRIRRWQNGTWSDERGPWDDNEINGSIELRDGALVFATMDDGVHLVRPDGTTLVFNHQTALIQNWARALFEDREGNLWIGAGSGGVAMVRRTEFSVLNSPDSWEGRTVLSVAPGKDGALWIGTEGSGVYRYFQNTWKHFGHEEGFDNLFVWSLTVDDEGQVWAGTWGNGAYRLDGDRFVRVPEIEVGESPVLALTYVSSDRTLWAGTGNGVLQLTNEKPRWYLHDIKPSPLFVPAMARDNQGATWLALGDGGLGRVSNYELKRYDERDGLAGKGVQCLLADGDTLWIGSREGGLDRFKNGQFASIGVAQGLPNKVVCHIADDGLGYLWISTHHGIFRVAKDELNRCADGLIPVVSGQAYDRNDGLPTLEFSGGLQAAGCRTKDGRLWFTSSKGVVSADPTTVHLNLLPPPVAVESLTVDGRTQTDSTGKTTRLTLRPDHERLEFQYTALSLAAPDKILFKYRLAGLDKDWIDAGVKRTAFYSHLPAGDYRFQVIACNNDGIWNTAGASLAFSVLPFYWQTWWFRSGVALLALGLVAWSVRYETRRRMQRRVEELEYERGIERERARIAQDIHDDIGSSLTRITMLTQSVRSGMDQPYQVTPVLGRIHDTAIEVTHTLDEIVWALDPQHDTLESLARYLARFAQERLGEAGVSCRLDLPMNLPAWPLSTQTRHNLLLAFKEALSNALKHAAATEVQIALELGRDEFVITMRDNGRGFDQSKTAGVTSDSSRIGNGLGNLRRRLAQIGGHCDIVSSPGNGTRIAFTIRLSHGGSSSPYPNSNPPVRN